MPRYYNVITQEIVEYPEDAAKLFDVLKPVPSDKAKIETDKPAQVTTIKDSK